MFAIWCWKLLDVSTHDDYFNGDVAASLRSSCQYICENVFRIIFKIDRKAETWQMYTHLWNLERACLGEFVLDVIDAKAYNKFLLSGSTSTDWSSYKNNPFRWTSGQLNIPSFHMLSIFPLSLRISHLAFPSVHAVAILVDYLTDWGLFELPLQRKGLLPYIWKLISYDYFSERTGWLHVLICFENYKL